MRTRHKISFIVLSAFLVFLTACNQNQDQDLTKDQLQWVEKTLSNMTIEEKVGQVLAPAISPGKSTSNPDPAARVKDWIQKYHIGHVYIASNRIDGGTIFPPLMSIAQTRSEAIAHTMAAITAKESRAMGIHLIKL